MHKTSYYIVNSITIYRISASVFLAYFIFTKQIVPFRWLLAVSFATDLVDGYLARKYKVTSVAGARLDSVADDLTFFMAALGVVILKRYFLYTYLYVIAAPFILYVIQTAASLIKYHKLSSFHTYLAKVAALLQGCFLILLFFLPQAPLWLFYLSIVVTALDLIEETVLVFVLPEWKADVKGLFWLKR